MESALESRMSPQATPAAAFVMGTPINMGVVRMDYGCGYKGVVTCIK